MYIGSRIAQLRKSKRMSLTELSQVTGIQMATLSRIEHLRMVGTLDSHILIAKALGIDITDLYRDIDKESSMVDFGGPQSRPDVFTHSEHSSYEILTKNILQKKMMPMLVHINPKGKSNTEQNQVGSEKFIYLIDGIVEVDVKGQKFTLHKTNTLYFDSSLPHSYTNIGKALAKMLCISTPVTL